MLKELAEIGDDDGKRIFPSIDYLARRMSLTPRWVRVVLAKLRSRGWLRVEREGGGTYQGGRGRRNVYHLTLADNLQTQRELPGFPQTFPQVLHNPDLSIRVGTLIDRSLYPDLSITKAPALSDDGATLSPVENAPIPSTYPSVLQEQIDPQVQKAHKHVEDDPAFQEALTRARMLKVTLETTPAPARRRHRR
ncbi:MAG TPA: hypothetical protein VGR82_17690 [Methylomirabilota bacterium]|jgi:hypothetical protein|nr:hypothetical protein [Methylomirabilota bacterium]